MKLFVLAFALLATSLLAEELNHTDIDWSTVKPIVYYPKFWDNKSPEYRPPISFFANYERQSRNLEGRIVGGQIAQPHQFPYQVALLTFIPDIGGQGFCGGSLVGTRTVLTAAHCVDGGTSGTAIFGAHFFRENEPNQHRQDFLGNHIILHPGWNVQLIQNDVAVVQVPSVVPVVPNVIRAVILPSASDVNYDFAGEDAVASGWGVFNQANPPVVSDVLRYVYDRVITVPQCRVSTIGIAGPNNICMTGTQNRGACNGDSGGPLTVRRGGESMHVGIASFVVASCHNTLPSVFVRTTSYLTWINANTV